MHNEAAPTSWQYLPLKSEDGITDAWLLQYDAVYYLYVPWPKTYLIRLSQIAVSELQMYRSDGQRNRTISEVLAIVPKYTDDQEQFSDCITMTLGVTTNCNLRCRYCFIGQSVSTDSQFIPIRAVELGAERLAKNAKDRNVRAVVHLQGGGEPTSNSAYFLRVVDLISGIFSRLGSEVTLSLTTNGTFDNDVRRCIIECFSSVSLSLDGTRQIHDLHRPATDGRGSFDLAFENGKALLKATQTRRLVLGIRSTVSQQSLPYLHEIHRFFSEHFPGVQVRYEPLAAMGDARLDSKVSSPDPKLFLEQMLSLHDIFGYDVSNHSACGPFDEVRTRFCKSLSIPTMNIDEYGRLVACQGYGMRDVGRYQYGFYDQSTDRFVFDMERVAQFRSMSVFAYPECHSCIAKYHCAGDCPALRVNGVKRCGLNRGVLLAQLCDSINHLGREV
jgi:uncharacterized protein